MKINGDGVKKNIGVSKARASTITLNQIIELYMPLIRFCAKAGEDNDLSGKHIWYMYRQCFYTFGEGGISDFTPKRYASKEALKVYAVLKGEEKTGIKLKNLEWKKQPKVDPERKQLILDHMYTGYEFRSNILNLHEGKNLNIASIIKLLRANYSLAWITRQEDKKLPKSKRPQGPEATYTSVGIELGK